LERKANLDLIARREFIEFKLGRQFQPRWSLISAIAVRSECRIE